MARTEDVAMRNFRKVRREMNNRLAKADREGRLEEELAIIERDALRWWYSKPTPRKPRRRAAQ